MKPFLFSTMALFLLYISAQIKRFSASSLDQIHLSLTKQQLRDVFAVSSHKDVPEYSLTRVRSRSKRDADGTLRKQVSLKAFGKRHNLRLSRNRDLDTDEFKVYFADTDQYGRAQYTRAEDVEQSYVGDPYQDEESGAAVIVHHDPLTDSLHLDGTIGPDLVIKPAPLSLMNNLQLNRTQVAPPDDEFFLDQDEDSFLETRSKQDRLTNPTFRTDILRGNSSWSNDVNWHKERFPVDMHFIIKRSVNHTLSDYAIMESDALPVASSDKKNHNRHKRSAPSTIYPEILIILDYDGYLLHEQNSNKIKKYIISFMNGVDLRYRSLADPMIKISMAGMIISRKSDATPYLENNMVTSDSIDSEAALTDLGRYLFRERRLPTYDIAMVLTKHDLCRRNGRRTGKCARGTAGFAYVGGACVVNKRMKKVNSVALVEDTGGFSGIIVAAHELGHLLGNVHDGSSAPPYLGGPGAGRCAWEEGYIMSDLRHTEKGFRWSPCSLEEFDFFLNGKTARCLYNAPHERQRLGRFLPGNLLSLDAQCQRDRGTSACFKDDRVCAQLFCFDQRTGYCVSYRPAAEGSPCGDGKVCRDGSCVIGESSSAGLNAHYTYALNGYITSATEHKAVWSKPPSLNSVQSAASQRGWSKLITQDRSTRGVRATTEYSRTE